MGMFDTIEVETSVENGPESGEYQTKDLESCLHTYVLEDNRLYLKLYKYKPVDESKKRHQLHFFESEYVGLSDTDFHGWLEIYGAYETWKLKFTDGELKECKLMESFAKPTGSANPQNEEQVAENQTLKDGEVAYWSGDGQEYTIDEEDDAGYDY